MNKYKLLNISAAEHTFTGGRKTANHILLKSMEKEETGGNEDVRSYKYGVYDFLCIFYCL